MQRPLLIAACAAALMACGCAHKRPAPEAASYRLESAPPQRLISPNNAEVVEVAGVRGPKFKKGSCNLMEGPFELAWKGSRAQVRVPTAQKELAPSEEPVEAFRLGVRRLEKNGCVSTGGAARILDTVAQSATMPSRNVYMARHGRYYMDAAMDVEPGSRLKVVGPLVKPGSGEIKVEATIPDQPGPVEVKISDNVIGFETSYYTVLAAPGGGVKLLLASVEQNRKGVITPAQKPEGLYVDPPKGATHMRVLFLRRASRSDRDITLAGAPTAAQLDELVKRLESSADPMEACAAEKKLYCLAIPRLSVLSQEALITANGKPVSVPVGATVRDALLSNGVRYDMIADAAKTLQIERPYRGKLLPVQVEGDSAALVGLVLLGGETLTWQ